MSEPPETLRSDEPTDRERWREERDRERQAWRRRREERRREREARRAEEREGRKERVLHTRISYRLSDDIRSVAEELRVPVSNLVRNVLEDVFSVAEVVGDNVGELVEDVVDEADRVAERLARRVRRHARGFRYEDEWREPEDRDEPAEGSRPESAAAAEAPSVPPEPPPPPPEFPDVLGWQPLVLNAPQRCAGCGRGLERGEEAYLGLAASGPAGAFLCRSCVP
jgi:hypothetical protein